MPTATGADGELGLLSTAGLAPLGVLSEASNVTVLADLLGPDDGPGGRRAVYKPIRGERPLRDFAGGTLALREVAAYLISELGGWHLVPPTVLRDGPLGPGSVQLWVEADDVARPASGLVDVLRPDDVTEGWLTIVEAQDETGAPLVVVHADDPRLRSLALLDVVLDNADRKAAHIGQVGERLWAFDHGLCLNEHPKLRTVLWGWAGQPLTEEEQGQVAAVLGAATDDGPLAELLSRTELDVLRQRCTDLLADPRLPLPPADRYPLPWPLW
ncbi:SCO1664 family protein [Ornithinimicrobium panacihumi]|uniref:SCO1664 family protein n=1 Tax=Ornithinimicrobium panacihumi TaxID=2008449 RepID=UPI003F8A9927